MFAPARTLWYWPFFWVALILRPVGSGQAPLPGPGKEVSLIGAILGAVAGYVIHLVAIRNGAGADLLSNPWVITGYGALLGTTALMGF